MGEPIVNGEKAHSQFLDHLVSYPFISDSISLFKSNPYGAKSLEYADQGYARFAKPVLPYFSTPYSYIAPYVTRADSLGDQGLSQIDNHFPLIREETQKIRGTIYNHASYPVRVAGDVKDHVFDTYGTEYKKAGGSGIMNTGKAAFTTSLLLSQESLGWVYGLVQKTKEEVKEAVHEKTNH
ncbi:uncharacterized protein N7483_001920 [Penicillium malachiteum]|uniref:uncharacterized protein n=1 Tax=Penicillium malachiteum TaxID=1324776 RepID=UPI00254708C1|nr:uncharacterized protein N7483_001920 [Penicillium malachiteum]KAJ5736795.1 hypothetical protein N7483_001920 [Penicillium malachiteum]